MIVLLDALSTKDDSTEFHDYQSKKDLPPDPTCHMMKLFSIPSLSIGQPIRLKGSIHSQPMTVLIDFGAVCNLLHVDVAHQLDLPIDIVAPIHFTIASHKQVAASLRAHNMEVKLQELDP